MSEVIQFELSKEFRDRFEKAITEKDDLFIRRSIAGVNSADITSLLYEFSGEESKYVLDLVSLDERAEVIKGLDSDTRKGFLKFYEPSELTAIIELLDSDDAADILNELPIKKSEEVISFLDPALRSKVIDLLRYDENVAGGLMAKELIKARDHWTVVQCVEEIRKQAEDVSKIYAIYVVDSEDRLLGVVSLQDLIISSPSTLVKDILDDDIVSVETFMEDSDVADSMQKYDLESVPVVNVQGKLVGRITIDDVLDVIKEHAEEDMQLMSGISEDVEEDDSVWRITRARLPWLVIGIIGGLVSARFIGFFEQDLLQITAIAFFIPLIQATGGNVGIQSSSIVVQSLAGPGIIDEGIVRRLSKVFSVAVLNGILLALIVLGANIALGGNQKLSFIVSFALLCVVIIASFVGTVTPLLLNRFGFNPALASGPFITTTNDLLGLAIYFLTIHILL